MRLQAADGRRHAQPEHAGVGERADQRLRQLPAELGLGRKLSSDRSQTSSHVDGIDAAGSDGRINDGDA